MKKVISIFLILLLIFSFTACATPDDVSNDNQSGDTDNPNGVNAGNLSGQGDEAMLFFEKYDDYLEYMQSHRIPDSFIRYEDLSEFGDFDSLTFLEEVTNIQYQSYLYSFGEDRIGLYVYHAEREKTERPILSSKSSVDMRTCDLNASADYYIEGIRYKYINGELFSIEWQNKGITFILSANNLHKYNGNNAIINKLLNRDTAMEVKANFDTMIVNKTAAVQ